MANQKANNLPPYQIIPTQVVSGNITSAVTDIYTKDNVNIQCVWTGTVAGTFIVQTSNDYIANPAGPSFAPLNAGTWSTLPLGTNSALGTPDSGVFDLNELSARYLRMIFTYASGAGNLTATITGKAI